MRILACLVRRARRQFGPCDHAWVIGDLIAGTGYCERCGVEAQ